MDMQRARRLGGLFQPRVEISPGWRERDATPSPVGLPPASLMLGRARRPVQPTPLESVIPAVATTAVAIVAPFHGAPAHAPRGVLRSFLENAKTSVDSSYAAREAKRTSHPHTW